ncbi:hypothetical protein NMY22_g7411 [Coprinellus aureogranulatus]|nr:hypothetical protein NMY22_g7411 [Coprinellus aureogranulatus]
MSSEYRFSPSPASTISPANDALLSWQARRISDLEESLHMSENHATLLLSRNEFLRERLVVEQQLCQRYIFEVGRESEKARLLEEELVDARREILTLRGTNETLVDLVLRLSQKLEDTTVALRQSLFGCAHHQADSHIPASVA